jgi:hypothetical protein
MTAPSILSCSSPVGIGAQQFQSHSSLDSIDILGSPVYAVLTLDAKEAASTDHKEV